MNDLLSSARRGLKHVLPALCLLSSSMSQAAPQPVRFLPGEARVIATVTAGAGRTVIPVEKTGTPVDGILITIPAGALAKETKVTISRVTGTLPLRSGKGSGAFLKLEAESVSEFLKPLEIEVSFDPKLIEKGVIVGYSIAADGKISPVDSGRLDREKGKVTFFSLVPLLFTWVSAPT